jgi:hypothetical protein
MLTFKNYRIQSRQSGKAYVTAECEQAPGLEAYAFVPFKPGEPDGVLFARAADTLAEPEAQARMAGSTMLWHFQHAA